MPELPDITVYVERLAAHTVGTKLSAIRLSNPFLLRTVDPKPVELVDALVIGVSRLGKRVVIELHGPFFIAIHLMKAGRLKWLEAGAKIPGKLGLAAFDFENGSLILTEAGSKRRASLHLFRTREALQGLNAGGIEIAGSTLSAFKEALVRENHTLKRVLTDPHVFSGIGNAYSDEILHRAKLSPLAQTQKLDDNQIAGLHEATQNVMREWTERLRAEAKAGWPEKVTAFRPEMAVHGRFREPCPVCQTPVQRIVYAENETNYCPLCQTGGRVLADRALSRLLKEDWPRNLDEMDVSVVSRMGRK
ncbi:MAG: formamidopyrimidine-DNA glycosylase [Sandaracinaceae bacterium]|nr:formamidopyrimidine-DNA glycosylase [Sandaracinaceae bacterium]